MNIVRYEPHHEDAVDAFNSRMRTAGVSSFQLSSEAPDRERSGGRHIRQDAFLAIDESDSVRGGYRFKYQPFLVRGEREVVANLQLPLSEGIVDRTYSLLGFQLLKDAMSREPALYALGMGGEERPLPQMLDKLGWVVTPCPFYFQVVRPRRFFRELAYLREPRYRAWLMDGLAYSGLGRVAVAGVQGGKRRLRSGSRLSGAGERTGVSTVNVFGECVDSIWEHGKCGYSLTAVRESLPLNELYRGFDRECHRLQVSVASEPVGWALVLATEMDGDQYFGDLTVGTVVDCFALGGLERVVVSEATKYLKSLDVDLIVTNQLHRSWRESFDSQGYIQGPSNFLFAASPLLTDRLQPLQVHMDRIHMTRADGDGPIHL